MNIDATQESKAKAKPEMTKFDNFIGYIIKGMVVGMVCLGFYAFYIAGVETGKIAGTKQTSEQYKKMLIDREFAEYNAKTGEWQMKNISFFLPNLPKTFDNEPTLMDDLPTNNPPTRKTKSDRH